VTAALGNACSMQDTHERPFGVNPRIEQPSAERVFAKGGALRYCPEHLYALEAAWLMSP
jgi:hypothetical protein